ncbi:hypothetical protein CLV78_106179 [Aliiruegeria haliotis]|uniref:Uncharacterized protein n=1 Tax=Aliiruegeria haliotis TaxID=1280846 RepID=A0A2T0RNA5_9RHOB|nr:hypothetical protein CLV78_106179 [Aliiruegeria haliotis]
MAFIAPSPARHAHFRCSGNAAIEAKDRNCSPYVDSARKAPSTPPIGNGDFSTTLASNRAYHQIGRHNGLHPTPVFCINVA